jgi:hypothetical protein
MSACSREPLELPVRASDMLITPIWMIIEAEIYPRGDTRVPSASSAMASAIWSEVDKN